MLYKDLSGSEGAWHLGLLYLGCHTSNGIFTESPPDLRGAGWQEEGQMGQSQKQDSGLRPSLTNTATKATLEHPHPTAEGTVEPGWPGKATVSAPRGLPLSGLF